MSSLFGKYAVVSSVIHEFDLENDWWWKIKPVTIGMELEMSKFLLHRRLVTTAAGRVEMPPTNLEIGFREVALCFDGTNIPKDADDPSPILDDDATIEKIEEVLREMPRAMFMEIWRAVGQSYPHWGPEDPNAS